MKKFVAMMMVLVAMIMTTAFAEIACETVTEDGKYIFRTAPYINEDDRYEMDITIGDHWYVVVLADDYDSSTGEWYAYYNDEVAWSDKEYTGEGDSEYKFEFIMGLIVNYYYDGMEL